MEAAQSGMQFRNEKDRKEYYAKPYRKWRVEWLKKTEQWLLYGSKSPHSAYRYHQKTITRTRHRFFPPPSKKRFLFGPGFIAWVQDFSDILLWPCRCGGKRREVRKAMAKKMAGLCAVFAKVKGFRELKKTLEDYDEEMDEL